MDYSNFVRNQTCGSKKTKKKNTIYPLSLCRKRFIGEWRKKIIFLRYSTGNRWLYQLYSCATSKTENVDVPLDIFVPTLA